MGTEPSATTVCYSYVKQRLCKLHSDFGKCSLHSKESFLLFCKTACNILYSSSFVTFSFFCNVCDSKLWQYFYISSFRNIYHYYYKRIVTEPKRGLCFDSSDRHFICSRLPLRLSVCYALSKRKKYRFSWDLVQRYFVFRPNSVF